jgi:hypothetical protein
VLGGWSDRRGVWVMHGVTGGVCVCLSKLHTVMQAKACSACARQHNCTCCRHTPPSPLPPRAPLDKTYTRGSLTAISHPTPMPMPRGRHSPPAPPCPSRGRCPWRSPSPGVVPAPPASAALLPASQWHGPLHASGCGSGGRRHARAPPAHIHTQPHCYVDDCCCVCSCCMHEVCIDTTRQAGRGQGAQQAAAAQTGGGLPCSRRIPLSTSPALGTSEWLCCEGCCLLSAGTAEGCECRVRCPATRPRPPHPLLLPLCEVHDALVPLSFPRLHQLEQGLLTLQLGHGHEPGLLLRWQCGHWVLIVRGLHMWRLVHCWLLAAFAGPLGLLVHCVGIMLIV